jgi:RNA polymerase sigma-70 factor, ECF subfamily
MSTIAAPISTTSDSAAWLGALRASGPAYHQAVDSLHALLLHGTRFELIRRWESVVHVRGDDLDDIAMQAADDALVAVLAKLDDFRGASRFTTWAYKFALLEAGVKLRRRAWQKREVVLDSESWTQLAETGPGPEVDADRAELIRTLTDCIRDDLTVHQRQVLVSLAIDGVPIDVLAERLSTTRGALYKTLHDARRKLRTSVAETGLPIEADS